MNLDQTKQAAKDTGRDQEVRDEHGHLTNVVTPEGVVKKLVEDKEVQKEVQKLEPDTPVRPEVVTPPAAPKEQVSEAKPVEAVAEHVEAASDQPHPVEVPIIKPVVESVVVPVIPTVVVPPKVVVVPPVLVSLPKGSDTPIVTPPAPKTTAGVNIQLILGGVVIAFGIVYAVLHYLGKI